MTRTSEFTRNLASARDKGPDYSTRGGEYSVLNNLLMHGVKKVEYVGTERAEAYGLKYSGLSPRRGDRGENQNGDDDV